MELLWHKRKKLLFLLKKDPQWWSLMKVEENKINCPPNFHSSQDLDSKNVKANYIIDKTHSHIFYLTSRMSIDTYTKFWSKDEKLLLELIRFILVIYENSVFGGGGHSGFLFVGFHFKRKFIAWLSILLKKNTSLFFSQLLFDLVCFKQMILM